MTRQHRRLGPARATRTFLNPLHVPLPCCARRPAYGLFSGRVKRAIPRVGLSNGGSAQPGRSPELYPQASHPSAAEEAIARMGVALRSLQVICGGAASDSRLIEVVFDAIDPVPKLFVPPADHGLLIQGVTIVVCQPGPLR
jgi:hypothetical protein